MALSSGMMPRTRDSDAKGRVQASASTSGRDRGTGSGLNDQSRSPTCSNLPCGAPPRPSPLRNPTSAYSGGSPQYPRRASGCVFLQEQLGLGGLPSNERRTPPNGRRTAASSYAVGAAGSRLGGGGVAEGGASSPAKPDHGSGCPPLLPDSRRMASAPGRSYRPTSTEADIERMAKAKKQNKTLKVNLINCKYEIVRKVTTEMLEFEEVSQDGDVWDLYWTDLSVSTERVARMLPFQCINHFPGMMEICRKATLARNLKTMRRMHPKDYAFFPRSWSLPEEMCEWRAECRQRRSEGRRVTYIVKPDAGAMGRGIHLVQREEDLDLSNPDFNGWVVQEYIDKPFLIDQYKFDLRLYVLVTCVDPLRIYLFDEGLARFATSKYQAPSVSNLHTMHMHLTNYSINKHSDEYVSAESDPNKGSKRRLTAVMQSLRAQGHNTAALTQAIEELVVKTFVSVAPHLKRTYRHCTATHMRAHQIASTPSRCFELLGFDVLIDQDMRPVLMEVNHSPSFEVDTKLDNEIKAKAIQETICVLGLSVGQRETLLQRQKNEAKRRLYGSSHRGRADDSMSSVRGRTRSAFSGPSGRITPSGELRRLCKAGRLTSLHTHNSRDRQLDIVENASRGSSSEQTPSSSDSEEDRPAKASQPSRFGGFRCIYPAERERQMEPYFNSADNISSC